MRILFILAAVLLFSFLIAIHEFGHFMTAKLFGVKVNEFSIFMGPAIWQKQKGETLYSLRTIPFGGYCAMEGEEAESDDPRSFGKAAWWKKIIILAAGAAMNFTAGFFMVLLIVGCVNQSPYLVVPTIDSFAPGNVVEGENGLHVGDTLYSMDGRRIYTSNDFTTLAAYNLRNEGYIHDIVVIRDGQKVLLDDFNLEPRMLTDEDGTEQLRYGLNLSVKERTLADTISFAWGTTLGYARSVPISFAMLFKGQASVSDVSGPMGIVKAVSDVGVSSASVADGMWNVVSFMSLIAVTLAIMNLLPIPALDGGHIVSVLVVALIEAVTRKKLDPKYESFVHAVGMVVLLIIMVLVSMKDVIQIFR